MRGFDVIDEQDVLVPSRLQKRKGVVFGKFARKKFYFFIRLFYLVSVCSYGKHPNVFAFKTTI